MLTETTLCEADPDDRIYSLLLRELMTIRLFLYNRELLQNDAYVDRRGRSDWSVQELIAFDMGGPFQYDVYTMKLNGSELKTFSSGNNAQGASFSPDGKWIAFTAYTEVANKDEASCEIYIMRVDGSNLRRLTNNSFCDYQPRWGK